MLKSSDILCITPTRERPDSIAKVADSFIDTSTCAKIVFTISDTDKKLIEYHNEVNKYNIGTNNKVFLLVTRNREEITTNMNIRTVISKALDIGAKSILYALINDDHIFRTKDWDKIVLDEFHKLNNLFSAVFVNDLSPKAGKFPLITFMPYAIIKHVKGLAPLCLKHYRIEAFWEHIVKSCGGKMHYLKEVIIEHMHYSLGKADVDETYKLKSTELLKKEVKIFSDYIKSEEYKNIVKAIKEN